MAGLDRMSISDKTRKALEKIGLTSYEIKTFSSLLKAGELTASELSQKSGVPYSKIYEVLGILEEKGWIGVCPFHAEGTDEMLAICPDTKTFKCNWCEVRGDMFDYTPKSR